MPKENKKLIQEDIKNYSSLESVKNSEGGQLILKSLNKDILSSIEALISKYKIASHIELIAIIASISERLTLSRSINRSSKNKKMAIEALGLLEEEDKEDAL